MTHGTADTALHPAPGATTPAPTTTVSVAIVGAGPAGLALAGGLYGAGISCAVVEQETRARIEALPRAGFLEEWAVRALADRGLADPVGSGGRLHHTCEFRFAGERRFLDYARLTGEHHIGYPQQELVKDLLLGYADGAAGDIRFDAADVELHALTSERPRVTYTDRASGSGRTIVCDYVVGCDGARGVTRPAAAALGARTLRSDLGVRWLTLLARAPASCDHVVFALHHRGFAMFAARGADATRYYLQLGPQEGPGDWPQERVWHALAERFAADGAPALTAGEIVEKRALDMHNYVIEPPAAGRLLLAGDAAHLLAPIAAKGMNLALNDAFLLADAFADHYHRADDRVLSTYRTSAPQRVWQYQEFTEWLSALMHGPSSGNPFLARTAAARLRRVTASETAGRAAAGLYLGVDTDQ